MQLVKPLCSIQQRYHNSPAKAQQQQQQQFQYTRNHARRQPQQNSNILGITPEGNQQCHGHKTASLSYKQWQKYHNLYGNNTSYKYYTVHILTK